MGAVFDRIKGTAELRVIDAMWARWDQQAAYARTVAQLYWSETFGT